MTADLLTVALLALLEALLSADNALVLAMMVLGLPPADHRKALRYGVAGAFAMRTVVTLFAVYVIRIGWVKLFGALYLLYLAWRHFFHSGGTEARRRRPPARAWLGLPPFWGTVVKVELVNIAFSVDSILVAVAISQKIWIVLAGGLLGILAIRVVVVQLLGIVRRNPAIVDGAFVIIAWVGLKLLIEYAHAEGYVAFEVPRFIALGVIVVIFGIALGYAFLKERRERTADAGPHEGASH
ncbi:MAG: TerC family protein [Vicinamibacterales bacterium]